MLTDFVPAPNIGENPDTYILENEALRRDGRLDRALASIAPYAGRDLLDIGSGLGFWLPHYAQTARTVIGVEPDPRLRERFEAIPGVELREGSAEQLPVADHSIDIAHARFAYFFGHGADAGLEEVRRVLRPSGCFLAIDNSWQGGHFAELLRDATTGNAAMDPHETANWWAARGAQRHEIDGGWLATSAPELESILRIEFPGPVVDRFLARHPGLTHLAYQFAVFEWRP